MCEVLRAWLSWLCLVQPRLRARNTALGRDCQVQADFQVRMVGAPGARMPPVTPQGGHVISLGHGGNPESPWDLRMQIQEGGKDI